MTAITTANGIRTAALAAALALAASGASAQTSPAASLGYAASPLGGQGYAVPGAASAERPLPVIGMTGMGMTGGIEPKDPEATGSIVRRPTEPRTSRMR